MDTVKQLLIQFWIFFLCFSFLLSAVVVSSAPNIIFILTDDQDIEIGGMNPMNKTKTLVGNAGITFSNMFVSSPLCCPSRSSILTGNYIHNHKARNNSINGGCSSTSWQKGPETQTFATYLKKQNYVTFFAGKYLNQYGMKNVGGPQHVPPGWDHWNGLVGNSKYYNYTLSVDGKPEIHKDNYQTDYLTDVVHRRAVDFLDKQLFWNPPFFMMLSTPACHAPFTPAPQYNNNFKDVKAPRSGSFNKAGKDKHWIVRQAKNPMSDTEINYIDNTYRNRWRTLLSVDDMVEDIVNKLKKKDLLKNTFIFFASDNGFHLGQFSLPNDKRHMYEFDIRVPLMVRGPGIKAGQNRMEPIVNIDLAPTFIDLGGGEVPSSMDGLSIKVLLESTQKTLWRDSFLVEYVGEYHDTNPGCPNTKNLANCAPDCVCNDAINNTYGCLRGLSDQENFIFCVFSDSENFVEYYDLKTDPNQLKNLAKTVDPKRLATLTKSLQFFSECHGPSCKNIKIPIKNES